MRSIVHFTFYLTLFLEFIIILFRYSSYNCLCFLTITSKIIPVIHNNIAITIEIPETISVGNLGTKPVLKYSLKTGIPNNKAKIKNINDRKLKNKVG